MARKREYVTTLPHKLTLMLTDKDVAQLERVRKKIPKEVPLSAWIRSAIRDGFEKELHPSK